MAQKLEAGDTQRFDCDTCSVEFEVTLEPKVKGLSAAKRKEMGVPSSEVGYCPCCGNLLTEDDEEDDDDE